MTISNNDELLDYCITLCREVSPVAERLMARAGVFFGMLGYGFPTAVMQASHLAKEDLESFEWLVARVFDDPVLNKCGFPEKLNNAGTLSELIEPYLEVNQSRGRAEHLQELEQQMDRLCAEPFEKTQPIYLLSELYYESPLMLAKILVSTEDDRDQVRARELVLKQWNARKNVTPQLLAIASQCGAFADPEFLEEMQELAAVDHSCASDNEYISLGILSSVPIAEKESQQLDMARYVLERLLRAGGFAILDETKVITLPQYGREYEFGPFVIESHSLETLSVEDEKLVEHFLFDRIDSPMVEEPYAMLVGKLSAATSTYYGCKNATMRRRYWFYIARTEGLLYYALSMSKNADGARRKKAIKALSRYLQDTPAEKMGLLCLSAGTSLGALVNIYPAVPEIMVAYNNLRNTRRGGKARTKGNESGCAPKHPDSASDSSEILLRRYLGPALNLVSKFSWLLRKSGRFIFNFEVDGDGPLIMSDAPVEILTDADCPGIEELFLALEDFPPTTEDYDLLEDRYSQRDSDAIRIVHEQYYLMHWHKEAFSCGRLYEAYAWAANGNRERAIVALCRQLDSKRPKGGRFGSYFKEFFQFAISIDAQSDPGFLQALRKSRLDGMFKEKQNKLAEERKQADAREFWDQGLTAADNANWENAILAFNECEKFVQGPELYSRRARAHINSGNLERAKADATMSIKLYSDQWEAYDIRGCVYHWLGKIDMAIRDFNKAVKNSNGVVAIVRCNRGLVYLDQQRYEKAVAEFTEGIELCDDDLTKRLFCHRGQAYLLNGNAGLAIVDAEHAITLDPSCTEAFITKAHAHLELGNLAEAKAALMQGALNGKDHFMQAEAYVDLALLLRTDEPLVARDAIAKALELVPGLTRALEFEFFD